MTKSMQNGEKLGFSLAEALITLLIVCLITLASIPILTKKRRNMEASGRGMWICSRNSNGDYVYWDKSHAVGQKDDPDTWLKTDTDSCTFTPPAGADRFSLTVVGGGGGGGDAKSLNISMARAVGTDSDVTTTFSPTMDGHYFVEVVGGGGGQGDIVESGEINGAASGAGGSGAAIYGYLWLLKGTTYSMQAGKQGKMGSSSYHSGYNRSSNSRTPGTNGGESFFKANSGGVDSETMLVVGGGYGGDSTSYNADNHAKGGAGGQAGVVKTQTYLDESKSVVGIDGYSGQSGKAKNWTYTSPSAYPMGGRPVGKTSDYGRGANGDTYTPTRIRYKHDPAVKPGYVEVSLIERYHGKGGNSAVPVSYYLPKINGVVVATIGDVASSNSKGESAQAVIMNNGVKGRTFVGYGGEGGQNSKYLTSPERGMDSQVTMKGGGTASPSCSDAQYVAAGYGPIDIPYTKCKSVKCVINLGGIAGNTTYYLPVLNKIRDDNIESSGVRVLPYGFEEYSYNGDTIIVPIGYDGSKNSVKIAPYRTGTNMQTYLSNTLKIYNYVNKNFSSSQWSSHFPQCNDGDKYCNGDVENGEFANYENYNEIYNSYKCYKDTNITYQKICEEEESYTKHQNGYHAATYVEAVCTSQQQGGNGTSFGSGGGGGFASLTPNVASRGGKGAPGAVIIEW